MKILVTGGAGYIGTLLVPRLLNRGYQVTILDNFMWGVKPILHVASHPDLTIVSGDVRDRDLVRSEVKKHDMIMHLASIVGYPACASDPLKAKSINVGGMRNVIDAMGKDQRIIFASTGSTYGKVDGICTEETPINPLSLYGTTKWEGEAMTQEKDGVSLRFATVFGLAPCLRLDLLINDFVYQALHNRQIVLFEGHFRRTFLHAGDAAESYLFTIDNFDAMAGNAYNVGDETMNYTKREVALLIQKHADYYLHEADIGEDQDKRDYAVSYEKIKTLGFRSTVGMEDGIQELTKVLKHLHITNEWRNA